MINRTISHYGIPGMKWGRRKQRVTNPSSDHSKVSELRKTKALEEMSNDELRAVVTRLGLERQFKDVSARQKSAGEKWIRSYIDEKGKQALNALLGVGERRLLKVLTDNYSPEMLEKFGLDKKS